MIIIAGNPRGLMMLAIFSKSWRRRRPWRRRRLSTGIYTTTTGDDYSCHCSYCCYEHQLNTTKAATCSSKITVLCGGNMWQHLSYRQYRFVSAFGMPTILAVIHVSDIIQHVVSDIRRLCLEVCRLWLQAVRPRNARAGRLPGVETLPWTGRAKDKFGEFRWSLCFRCGLGIIVCYYYHHSHFNTITATSFFRCIHGYGDKGSHSFEHV